MSFRRNDDFLQLMHFFFPFSVFEFSIINIIVKKNSIEMRVTVLVKESSNAFIIGLFLYNNIILTVF